MLTDQLLGLLKLVLLIALYLFFARVLWAVWHEVRTPALQRAVINDVPVAQSPIERTGVPRGHRVNRLVIVAPADLKNTEIALGSTDVMIGRAPDCTLRLGDDTGVSARHATVRVVDGYVLLEDLGSTNGTFVNGKQLSSPTRLAIGDRVDIGVVIFEAKK